VQCRERRCYYWSLTGCDTADRIATIQMTSSGLQGHAPSASLLKCDFLYSCAAADKISRQHVAWSPYTRAELLVFTNTKNQRILQSTTVTVKQWYCCPNVHVLPWPGGSCNVQWLTHRAGAGSRVTPTLNATAKHQYTTLNASNGPTAGPIS